MPANETDKPVNDGDDDDGFVIEAVTTTFVLEDLRNTKGKAPKVEIITGLSLEDFQRLKGLISEAKALSDVVEGGEKDVAKQEATFAAYARRVQEWGDELLVSWNVKTRKGEPMPATGLGFLRLPPDLRNAILRTWMETVSKPSAPLSKGSASGGTSRADRRGTGRRSGNQKKRRT